MLKNHRMDVVVVAIVKSVTGNRWLSGVEATVTSTPLSHQKRLRSVTDRAIIVFSEFWLQFS